uniref:AlNc14C102G6082 protein n=1 Tax=Albugo laibachii Nc14 TaxID=890382 RepID=F0WHK0_9STRA|nr:AlNc14C102G6082 [Albugo laibachii Nc14]|eukprot:CCA20738.1 AlNc14C102G6082 [Albugo laibachii Nc14]
MKDRGKESMRHAEASNEHTDDLEERDETYFALQGLLRNLNEQEHLFFPEPELSNDAHTHNQSREELLRSRCSEREHYRSRVLSQRVEESEEPVESAEAVIRCRLLSGSFLRAISSSRWQEDSRDWNPTPIVSLPSCKKYKTPADNPQLCVTFTNEYSVLKQSLVNRSGPKKDTSRFLHPPRSTWNLRMQQLHAI